MKVKLFPTLLFAIAFFRLTTVANATSGQNVAILYTNAPTASVEKIDCTGSSCILTIHVYQQVGSSFSISPHMYLSDEQGNRHPLLRAEGVEIGKNEYITQPDGREFTLTFEAFPKGTRYFDLIEGGNETAWRIFGIHDKRDERSFPLVSIDKNNEELSPAFFTKAPITIKGRFTDYQRQGMPHIVQFNYHNERSDWMDPTIYPYCCMVQADGTFEYHINYDRPIWADMSFDQGGHNVGFYVRPGDVLEITFDNLGKEDERIVYHNVAGRATCEKLFSLTTDIPWNNPYKEASYIEPVAYRHMIDSICRAIEQGINYQAWKWRLTPWETHLLRTNHRLDLLSMYMAYIKQYYVNQRLNAGHNNDRDYLTAEDYAFIRKLIDWSDPSNAITQIWYGANNFIFSQIEEREEWVNQQLEAGTSRVARGDFADHGFESVVKRMLPDIAPIILEDLKIQERSEQPTHKNHFAVPAQDPVADALLKRLAAEAGSQYVQVVLLDPRGADYNHGVSGQTHWMADFRNDSTISFIFVISDAMTEKDKETLAFWFQNEKRAAVSEEEFIHLQAAFRITAPAGAATINRDGNILTYRSDSRSETSFRDGVRSLKRLEQTLGVMNDK